MRFTWSAWGRRPRRNYELLDSGRPTGVCLARCEGPATTFSYYVALTGGTEPVVIDGNACGYRVLAIAKAAAVETYLRIQRTTGRNEPRGACSA